jgi:hypothetical protein
MHVWLYILAARRTLDHNRLPQLFDSTCDFHLK